jgi:cell division protease FtsH
LEGPRTPTFLPVPTQGQKEYSEETARLVDEEIKKVLSEAHGVAQNYLSAHRQALEELAKLLLEKEVVERPALQAILARSNGYHVDEREISHASDSSQPAPEHKN